MSTFNKRIAKNTIFLYIRQIITVLISLYMVRVVLRILGVEDFGIYNVVAGTVSVFYFLSWPLSLSCQRFFSYAIGQDDYDGLCKLFNITILSYVILSVIILCLSETVGRWFIANKLNIPVLRMPAAQWMFQFAILSFVATIMAVPYTALIVSHEEMNVFAYVSMVDAALKLGFVFLVPLFPCDKLIAYGILMFGVSCFSFSIYVFYCQRKYSESKIQFIWDFSIFKQIVSFSGWNCFGGFASIMKNQGISFLLNIFWGPLLNTSQGIANQIRGGCLSFSEGFNAAIKPQIFKFYAVGDYRALSVLILQGSKITFFLVLIVILPLIFSLNDILSLWLGEMPPYIKVFVKLILIESLIDSISLLLGSANQATGKISLYQFLIGFVCALNLPIAYVTLKLGYAPWSVCVIGVILQSIIVLIRVLFLHRIWPKAVSECLIKTIFPCVTVAAISFAVAYIIPFYPTSHYTFICRIMIDILVVGIVVWTIGFTRIERKNLFTIFHNKMRHILFKF